MPVTGAAGVATKYTLVLINLLFAGLGLAAMAVGGWVLLNRLEARPLTWLEATTNEIGMMQDAAILVITSGIVIFIVGILGCCGAYKERKCMLGLYIALIVVVTVITAAAIAVTFLYKDEMEDKLLTRLREGVINEFQGYTTSERPFSTAMDYAQIEFQCCGVLNYSDYALSTNWTARESSVIPKSCCVIDRTVYREEEGFYVIKDPSCGQTPNSTNSHIDTSCYGKLKDWMEQQIYAMGGVTIAVLILEVLAVIFAVLMIKPQSKDTDYFYRV